MNRFEWANTATTDEALEAMIAGGTVKAGGIDLIDRMKEGLLAPSRVVNIRNLRGLDRIFYEAKSGLHIGPLVTLAQFDSSRLVSASYPALADAASQAATPQIRNVATIGGNLLQRPRCWYFRSADFNCSRRGGERCFAIAGENQYHAIFANDACAIVHPSSTATALVAYHAQIEITSAKRKRMVELEEFFLLPSDDIQRENIIDTNELITDIVVPPIATNTRSAYLKLGEKESHDWPIAEVAVALTIKGGSCEKASIVLGAAAPIPWRSKEAEAALNGRPITEETARAAAVAAMTNAMPLSGNAYKLAVFEAVIRRAILAAAKGA